MRIPKEILEKVEKLDSTTYNHSKRVHDICLMVEQEFFLTDDILSSAGIVHDIGKLYVPVNVLDKHGCLSPLEREVMDFHSYYGYELLEEQGVEEDIKRIVLYHHSFEPNMIRRIPLQVNDCILDNVQRLRTIDMFEALTADRPYHRRVSVKQAVRILMKDAKADKELLLYLESVIPDFERG